MTPARTDLERRAFLRRLLGAGAAAAAVGLGAGLVRRPDVGRGSGDAPFTLPDFRAGTSPGMAIVTTTDRRRGLERAFAALGGIERYVRPGDRVILKVNAAFATPASLGATTHPDVVEALVRLCLGAGAADVVVTDNPMNDPAAAFELSGIAEACRRAGGRLALPAAGTFQRITLPGGRFIRDWPFLTGPLEGATRLIGVAPVKDHTRAGASMTLKNWYGLLGGERSRFHQDVHGLVAELAAHVRPTLVVLDGVTAMMRNGPTGGSTADLAERQTLVVGTDPVAVDAFGVTLLDRAVGDVAYLAQAEAAGAGTTDFATLPPLRARVD